ncbi:MAG: KH domain-containing protein [Candidatus Sulfotelmatobacter sp.]
MTEATGDVRALVEQIAKWMVDAPDEVYVDHLDGDVIELEVAEADVGKIIGRQGRNVRALRALLSAAGMRARKRYTLEVID